MNAHPEFIASLLERDDTIDGDTWATSVRFDYEIASMKYGDSPATAVSLVSLYNACWCDCDDCAVCSAAIDDDGIQHFTLEHLVTTIAPGRWLVPRELAEANQRVSLLAASFLNLLIQMGRRVTVEEGLAIAQWIGEWFGSGMAATHGGYDSEPFGSFLYVVETLFPIEFGIRQDRTIADLYFDELVKFEGISNEFHLGDA